MPLIDMALGQLREYRGLNPRPEDFDAYWDESLRELDALSPMVELIPNKSIHAPYAECFDLWFQGIGGARIYAKYLPPKSAEKKKHPGGPGFFGYFGCSRGWLG